jgi:hypothetical protein
MYADESGDSGLVNSPTRFFVLSGVVLHETRWHHALDHLLAFRKRIRSQFGLLLSEEIHCGPMLSRPGSLTRIAKHDRLAIIRHFIDELATLPYLNVITVRVDKQGKPAGYDPFERAWEALIQRFENTVGRSNFPDARLGRLPLTADPNRGLIFCDQTDAAALRSLYRRMRAYNPIPNTRWVYGSGYRQMPLSHVVEDPSVRNSEQSYFIQAADAAAFAAYQMYEPSTYVKNKGARQYYRRLDPILCKRATRRHDLGIVEL